MKVLDRNNRDDHVLDIVIWYRINNRRDVIAALGAYNIEWNRKKRNNMLTLGVTIYNHVMKVGDSKHVIHRWDVGWIGIRKGEWLEINVHPLVIRNLVIGNEYNGWGRIV
ncbi:hypothetical protein HanIR_Chr04g0172291 [Helianthus annuus]|nr:hypothetical protein HanIR_Chr04g0172291 [Helianthus annuus]